MLRLTAENSPAVEDSGGCHCWTQHLAPLEAAARGVNPRYAAHVTGDSEDELTIEIRLADQPFTELSEVAITRFSTGAAFSFTDRGVPLPLTVI